MYSDLKKFLQTMLSDQSDVSSMRVMSFICVFVAGVIGILALFREDASLADAAMLVAAFLLPAFGGKVGQKFAENNQPKVDGDAPEIPMRPDRVG